MKRCSLRVLDGVFVYCLLAGLSLKGDGMASANKYKVPRMGFVNKMDRAGAVPCVLSSR